MILLTKFALFVLSTLSAKQSACLFISLIKLFRDPYNTKHIEKYGSNSFSFRQASINLALLVIAHIYFLVNFSPMISRHEISEIKSSFWFIRSFSNSSSSSTTPLNAKVIFLHPLMNYFLTSLSSIIESLKRSNIEFSLFIL